MAYTKERLELDEEVLRSIKIMHYESATEILKSVNEAVLSGVSVPEILAIIDSLASIKRNPFNIDM